MANKKAVDWAALGGYPQTPKSIPVTKNKNVVDWTNLGGYPEVNRESKFSNANSQDSNGLIGQIMQGIGGGLTGLAQGGSDIGANIAQFPSDIYTYLTGKEGYKAPKPDIRAFGPQTEIGKGFEKGGEFTAPFVLSPGLAAETILGKAMYGGKLLPRLITDALLGGAESEDRGIGAGLGLTMPAIGKGLKFLKETPLTKSGAVKNIEKAKRMAGEESLGIPMSIDFLRNMEYQLQSSHLKPSKMAINTLMGEAAKGDYPSYFKLQSALGDIGRELSHPAQQTGKGFLNMISNLLNKPQTSAAERLTGQQLNDLRNQYIKQAMEHLTKTGKGNIAKTATQGTKEYSNYMKFRPYRNAVIGAALSGIPGYEILKHIFNH